MTETVTEAMIEAGAAAFRHAHEQRYPFEERLRAAYVEMSRASQPVDTGVGDLRAKFRNVVSHATGGHYSEPDDVDRSLNDICVEISRHRNLIWKQAQESALKDVTPPLDSEAVERVRKALEPFAAMGRVMETRARVTFGKVPKDSEIVCESSGEAGHGILTMGHFRDAAALLPDAPGWGGMYQPPFDRAALTAMEKGAS